MAGIDKTYTDSYADYREFKDWADGHHLTFFDGADRLLGIELIKNILILSIIVS